MDAMKQAFQNRMKQKPEMSQDQAPPSEGEPMVEGGDSLNLEGLPPDLLMQILQAIADQGRGGKEDNSLGGRAAMLAKSKISEMDQ